MSDIIIYMGIISTQRTAVMSPLKNSNGFSLVEVTVIIGIMGVIMLVMTTMQSNQMKANNYLEFQLKRTQLHGTIAGQFLNDSSNCKCLFSGATEFPVAGVANLVGVAPTQIGRYNFVTAGVCATATIPAPLVDGIGIDGMKTTSIQLRNITNISGSYSGSLTVNLQSTKDVLGPRDLPISIPVSISTTPGTPGNVVFQSCALSASGAGDRTLDIIKNKSDVPAGNESPTFGGNGGYASSKSSCRGSAFVNGFSVRTGSRVDRLNANCLSYDGLLSSTGGIIGGSGGGSVTNTSCPTGTYASGIRGRSGSYIDAFGLRCTNPITLASSLTPLAGGSSGSAFFWDCPAGTYIFELISTSGSTMDSIQAICARM